MDPRVDPLLVRYMGLRSQCHPPRLKYSGQVNYFGLYHIVRRILGVQSEEYEQMREELKLCCARAQDQARQPDVAHFATVYYILLTGSFDPNLHAWLYREILGSRQNIQLTMLALANMDRFDTKAQQHLLFRAFSMRHQIHAIDQLHASLREMQLLMTRSGFSYEALDYTTGGHDRKVESLLDPTRDYAREYADHANMAIDRVHDPALEGPAVRTAAARASEQSAEASAESQGSDAEADQCIICYGGIDGQTAVRLQCTHVLCCGCLQRTGMTCPICRARITQFAYQNFTFKECEPEQEAAERPEPEPEF